jgi:ectoine hydroxylase-related dioxygenase (phytanoyl-CoA dioxygenase family)
MHTNTTEQLPAGTAEFHPTSSGYQLEMDPECFGELRRSDAVLSDTEELRTRLGEDGYLYLPGFFERDEVVAVYDEFVRRLAQGGALHPDYTAAEAIASPEPVALSREAIMRDNPLLPQLVFSPQLLEFYQRLLGGPVRHYDHIWTRLIRPGKGTRPHCDLPYMGRGTRQVMTAWIPYRDTDLRLGGLMMLEQSHLQAERIRRYLASDVDTYCTNRGPYQHKHGLLSNNPVSLRQKFGGRWLTAGFRAGDLLTFGMTMIHASLDNQTDAYRISTDTRYQLAAEPIDERWIGPDTEEYSARNRIGKIC